MPNLRPTELIVILLIIVLLFGAKKLPELAKGIGQSLKIFRDETKLDDSTQANAQAAEAAAPVASAPAVAAAPVAPAAATMNAAAAPAAAPVTGAAQQ